MSARYQKTEDGRCIDPRPLISGYTPWRCDGEWHKGWNGHDPYCERCPDRVARTQDTSNER